MLKLSYFDDFPGNTIPYCYPLLHDTNCKPISGSNLTPPNVDNNSVESTCVEISTIVTVVNLIPVF